MELIPYTATALPFTIAEMEGMLASRLAPSSIAMYQRDVQAYLTFAQQHTRDVLHPSTLMYWRDALVLETRMSPNTINRMLSAVRRLMKEAATRNRLDEDTAAKFARVEGVAQKALKSRLKDHARTRIEPGDMRRLCMSPDTTTSVGIRDKALLAVLASSGIRVDELVSLKWEQVRVQGTGFILSVRGKTDTEFRSAHLSSEAHHLLQLWLAARPVPSDYIFTSFSGNRHIPSARPLSKTAIWKIITHYAELCQLPHLKPHDFRRFIGTQLASTDIRKAQKALGHKSIETTARHYVIDDIEVGLTDNLY